MRRLAFVLLLGVGALALLAAPALAAKPVAPVHVAYVHPPAVPHGSKLVMDIHFMDINGEDSGSVGYWAFLPATREHVKVWQIPDGSFYSIEWMRGTWITYAGVPSSNCDPVTGLPVEQAGGSGSVRGWITWTFTGSLIPGLRTFGWKPTVDEKGSPADVQLGWYDKGQNANIGPWWFWYTDYFLDADGNPIDPSAMPDWGSGWEVYRYRDQAMIYNTAATGTTGNIVVTK